MSGVKLYLSLSSGNRILKYLYQACWKVQLSKIVILCQVQNEIDSPRRTISKNLLLSNLGRGGRWGVAMNKDQWNKGEGKWTGKGLHLMGLDFHIEPICNSHVVTHRKENSRWWIEWHISNGDLLSNCPPLKFHFQLSSSQKEKQDVRNEK